jgi:hypothetical protein
VLANAASRTASTIKLAWRSGSGAAFTSTRLWVEISSRSWGVSSVSQAMALPKKSSPCSISLAPGSVESEWESTRW